MRLKGIEFGHVLGASGVQGFFGEGYWFHSLGRWVGLDLSNITFVSKTATLYPQQGNMPLKDDFTPKHLFPSCVKVHFFQGQMLNAVGLSNPGLPALLEKNQWQKRTKPFFISVTSLQTTKSKRLDEFKTICDLFLKSKQTFQAPFGLQVNLSCPNTAHNPKEAISETQEILEILSPLQVPLMPKYSIASAPLDAIMELDQHQGCDAICVSNTLPFGWQQLDWKKVWGSNTSELSDLGGGGLSGKSLRPLVCQWIFNLRQKGFSKPIDGGGGILNTSDVDAYIDAGANTIYLGSVVTLRPWRVPRIIQRAHQRLS